MVRPKNQHRYKQYEESHSNLTPPTQFETMFTKSSSSKRDTTNLNSSHIKDSKKKERTGWERKQDKTHYNEQALAINSKSKVDKSANGASKHRNYQEQHASNQKPTKTRIEVDDEKDTDDSEEFFQLIRDTVADSVKVCVFF